MKTKFGSWWRRAGVAALGVGMALSSIVPAQAAPWNQPEQFANGAFAQVWSVADQAVTAGTAARSYTWGPRPWFDYYEAYRNAPNGLRQVQYFDKARMEINNPANRTPRGVTNGLLTVELVSGRLKVGDGVGSDDNLQRDPAQIPVAGNPAQNNPAAPTYASFRGVATIDNGYRDPNRTGQRVSAVLDKGGNLTTNAAFGEDPATEIVTYNTITGHNVPRVFRDFIQNGPVDGTFAFGLPVTDAYWIRARVGSEDRDVMVQLFERRAVTYTPANTPSFRVEMGNVGQHYFQWRYPQLGLPWRGITGDQRASIQPIAYASKLATPDHWETYVMTRNGFDGAPITSGSQETVPYSWRRTYIEAEPSGLITFPQPWRLMVDSKRSGTRQLYSINQSDSTDVRQHTDNSTNSIVYNGAVSPDGNLIAAVVQDDEQSALAILSFNQERATIVPSTPGDTLCRYESPTWLPNGSGLVFAANCTGKQAIYRANLRVDPSDPRGFELVDITAITNTPNADNYFPRVSPDGSKVVFSSSRNGNGDVYLINIDGTGETRLTTDPADDGAATWAANSREIAFDSNRDGDYEIYRMDLNNPSQPSRMTDNNVDDRWPIWEQ